MGSTILFTIHHYWLGQAAGSDPVRIRRSFDLLNTLLQRTSHKLDAWKQAVPGLAALYLSRNEPYAVVWVLPGEQPPHHQSRYQPPAQAANDLARDLALPGCATAADRARKVGLVAVSYAVDANSLFKPSFAQAGAYAEFFPGRKTEQHGRTAPLDATMQLPWQRSANHPGLAEWVHDNQPISKVLPSLKWVGAFV